MRGTITTILLAAAALSVWLYFVPAFSGNLAIASSIQLGPAKIHLYGLVLAIAILVCFILAAKFASKVNLSPQTVEGVLPWVVIFGFIGARVYFVLFSWAYFENHISEIFQVWRGGYSIYGAIIGGVLGAAAYARWKGLPGLAILDLIALVAPLGQSIGRFGNFFNQEAFGRPTDLPWGLYIAPQNRPLEFLTDKFFHPTFLYESLWNLAVFFILFYLFRRNSRRGMIFATYLILYSIGRFFVEDLRTDSFDVLGFRADQIVALIAVSVGAVLMYRSRKRYEPENN